VVILFLEKAFDLARAEFAIVQSEACFAEISEVLHRKKFKKYFSSEEAALFL
jgi:predicted nucleic acid-binding protein